MSLKHGLLGILHHGPMAGYDLNQIFNQSLNFFWAAETSQIYRELNSMEKQGWLSSEIVLQTEKPNRKVYSLTDSGREEFIRWLSTDDLESSMKVRHSFIMRIFFSGRRPMEATIDSLKAYQAHLEAAAKAMESVESSISRYEQGPAGSRESLFWRLTADYGRRSNRMAREWAENAINLLKGENHE